MRIRDFGSRACGYASVRGLVSRDLGGRQVLSHIGRVTTGALLHRHVTTPEPGFRLLAARIATLSCDLGSWNAIAPAARCKGTRRRIAWARVAGHGLLGP